MASKTRVVYQLDMKMLSQLFGRQPHDISITQRLAIIRLLADALQDAYGESAGFSGMDSSNALYGKGFAVEVTHPERLPEKYPSHWSCITKDQIEQAKRELSNS